MKIPGVYANFNGLFGDILCLSHSDTCIDEHGETVQLRAGLNVIAFDEDLNDVGERDDLIATGIVARSPIWLRCRGSKWILKIDENGVRHESEIKAMSNNS
jgi:hypothetical protein